MQSVETPCVTCAGLGGCRSCAGIGYFECQNCAVSGRVRCQNCGGQGTIGCGPCHGSGEIEITPARSYTCGMHSNPCQNCGGTGNRPVGQVCGDCQNTGMVSELCPYTHFPLTTCPACDNTEMISEPCPSCISDDGAPICAGCSGSQVVGTTTQSAVVRLEFPAGSERHMATRYKVYVNGQEYTTLSFHNRTAFIEAPYLGRSKDIVWMLLRDKGSATGRDSAGSRYRKIGLNGVPLSDSKPQSQDESGEPPEETYVDAYTRQLRHSVSDVYAQPEHGGQLPLVVRRDVSPETWSPKGGLRLPERPDLPFGPGWSSNLCSYVRFELPGPCSTAEIKATVVDETGAHQSFLLKGGWWHHSKEELADLKTAMNQFTAAEVTGSRAVTPFFPKFAGITLTKKFGTTCHYEMTDLLQAFPSDRTNNTGDHVIYRYARLVRAVDRYGNELRYDYAASAPKSLIPYKIHDPQRPGHQLTIQENNGLISDIRGPGGETIHYGYSLVGAAGAPPLSSVGFLGAYALSEVTRGGESEAAEAATVKYDYSVDLEADPTPLSTFDVDVFLHLNLTSITDEMNRVFSFDYTRSRGLYYTMTQAGVLVYREQTALPDEVTSVTSPAGQVTITGVRSIRSHFLPPFMQVLTAPQTNVTGPCGTYTYHWSDPNVQVPGFSPNFGVDLGASSIPVESAESARYSLNFTRMDIVSAAGTETYQFNPTAAMALATATDISGNTTTFTYGTEGYDDPLTETDALGKTKTYTYDPGTRIMASMTDALGTVTAYGIQNQVVDGVNIQGLKVSEIVTGVGGASRTTFYKYEHPVFKGMVTSQWTLSPNATAMPASVTTTTLGAATGAQGANPGWWREVTQTTGTATGQGVLGTALTTTTTISDLGGKKRSVIDGRGLITNFDYDELGRLIQVTHPDNTHKDLAYDAHGNLLAETNENGVSTFHEYDSQNRRIKSTVDLNGNGVANTGYTTANSQPGTANSAPVYDGDLVTTTTYNAFNQPVDETNARGVVTHHDYDSAGASHRHGGQCHRAGRRAACDVLHGREPRHA
jgi:YD repeat-containing protein